jgi:uncharacterized protein (TIGR02246 family)
MGRAAAAVSLLALLIACQPAAPKVDAAAEEAAIRAQVAAFQSAVTAYDEAAIGAVYTPDAALLPASMPKLTGRAAIERFFGVLERAQVTLTLTPVSVVVAASGDIALEEGTWTWSNPNPDGSTTTDNGKYLVGWKKIDGTWLMQTDIWNSDNPPLGAPAGS